MEEGNYDYQFEQDAERARIRREVVDGFRDIGLYAAGVLVTIAAAGAIMITSALGVNPSYAGEKLG